MKKAGFTPKQKNGLLWLLVTAMTFVSGGCMAETPKCNAWPDWTKFNQNLVSEDGRVIDPATEFSYTTSEGQSYALFFALIANDQPLFASILGWTENNLAGGAVSDRLPAWQWGKRKDGSWGVTDSNSASDSDLWIAYVLLEAGRLWQKNGYTIRGKLLAQRILDRETAVLPGLGLTLLPGPTGFRLDNKTWRLNPSYSPIQLLRGLYHHTKDQKWLALIKSAQRLIIGSAPKGFVPDWINYHADSGFDHQKQSLSYNAIRAYLWTGMMAKDEPLRQAQLDQLRPVIELLSKYSVPPESVDITTGKTSNTGPIGFSAALLPFLKTSNANNELEQQLLRLVAYSPSEVPKRYYDQVLVLFGLAWMNGLYRFDAQGLLLPNWKSLCPA